MLRQALPSGFKPGEILHALAAYNVLPILFARSHISDSAIHLTAAIFGEAELPLSMTILRIAAKGGRIAIID